MDRSTANEDPIDAEDAEGADDAAGNDAEDEPLFDADIHDRLRGYLRSIGLRKETVEAMDKDELAHHVQVEEWKRDLHREHRAALPGWIEKGYVSAEVGYKMRRWELREFAKKVDTYEEAISRTAKKEKQALAKRPVEDLPVPGLTRGEVLTVLSEAVAVIAALQAEVTELRHEVAAMKSAKLAVFGKQEVIEQLSNASRDFEGVDVTMDLQEESIVSSDEALEASEKTHAAVRKDGDLAAQVEGLASIVAGLNVGGKIDMSEMNTAARNLRSHAKAHARVKTHGKVRIKIAKVSGGGGK